MPVNLGVRVVDPNDIRIYNIDWTLWLNKLGTTISLSVWTVPPALNLLQQSNTTTKTSIKLNGWVSGNAYTVYNTVTTSSGETRRVGFDIECP